MNVLDKVGPVENWVKSVKRCVLLFAKNIKDDLFCCKLFRIPVLENH